MNEQAIEPAFPVEGHTYLNHEKFTRHVAFSRGLTKREYYAGLAMQGICANGYYNEMPFDQMASMACTAADALLAALNTNNQISNHG